MSNSQFFNEKDFLHALSGTTRIPFVDLETTEIDPLVIKYVSEKLARERGVIPIRLQDNELTVAMCDPTDFQTIDDIKISSGKRVTPVLASQQALNHVIERYYTQTKKAEQAIKDFGLDNDVETVQQLTSSEVEGAPIVRIVNSILMDASNMKASDIHIEPFEKEVRVRLRVDGELRQLMSLPINTLSGIVTRIKIMANLNIAETKRPQDGRVQQIMNNKKINMRISFIPAVYGEKVVIRLLNSDNSVMDKSEIGLSPFNMQQVERMMKISEGIILLTGPTGSGKTTTLYALLKDFNTINRNIITLEDPVEFSMHGINQVQVNSEIGMTFASGLRAILRQDPDIIAVGEIRDGETAEIAMRSAITGHVVLSTIHTSDALGTVERLVDMGVEPYLVASALKGVLSQRLVRRICPNCRQAYEPSEDEQRDLGLTPRPGRTFYRGTGCPECFDTGYRGRTAVFEIFSLPVQVRRMVAKGAAREDLETLLKAPDSGFVSLKDNAIKLVEEGKTTSEEVLRVIYEDI